MLAMSPVPAVPPCMAHLLSPREPRGSTDRPLSRIRKAQSVKLILLGDSGVGKTSLIDRFVRQQYHNRYTPTVGADFIAKEMRLDGRIVYLHVWDTAGTERFQSLGTAFYRGVDGCVLVFDVARPSTLKSLESWRDQFLTQGDHRVPEHVPLLVLGNKVDLPAERRAVSTTRGQRWADGKAIPYLDVSALDGQNVDKAFETMVRMILDHKEDFDLYMDDPLDSRANHKLVGRKVRGERKKGCPC